MQQISEFHSNFLTKVQSAYLTELQENLPSNHTIILLDFVENYSFIGHDAVEEYH